MQKEKEVVHFLYHHLTSPHPHRTSLFSFLTLVNRKKGGLRTPQLHVNFSLFPMSAMKLWVMESQPLSPGLVLL